MTIDGSMINQGLIGMQRSQAEILRSAEQIAAVVTAPGPFSSIGSLAT